MRGHGRHGFDDSDDISSQQRAAIVADAPHRRRSETLQQQRRAEPGRGVEHRRGQHAGQGRDAAAQEERPARQPVGIDAAQQRRVAVLGHRQHCLAAARAVKGFDAQYQQSGASYSPQILAGKTQEEIAAALADPKSPIAQAIVGSANVLTAAICATTDQQPAAVCTSSGVKAGAAKLGS